MHSLSLTLTAFILASACSASPIWPSSKPLQEASQPTENKVPQLTPSPVLPKLIDDASGIVSSLRPLILSDDLTSWLPVPTNLHLPRADATASHTTHTIPFPSLSISHGSLSPIASRLIEDYESKEEHLGPFASKHGPKFEPESTTTHDAAGETTVVTSRTTAVCPTTLQEAAAVHQRYHDASGPTEALPAVVSIPTSILTAPAKRAAGSSMTITWASPTDQISNAAAAFAQAWESPETVPPVEPVPTQILTAPAKRAPAETETVPPVESVPTQILTAPGGFAETSESTGATTSVPRENYIAPQSLSNLQTHTPIQRPPNPHFSKSKSVPSPTPKTSEPPATTTGIAPIVAAHRMIPPPNPPPVTVQSLLARKPNAGTTTEPVTAPTIKPNMVHHPIPSLTSVTSNRLPGSGPTVTATASQHDLTKTGHHKEIRTETQTETETKGPTHTVTSTVTSTNTHATTLATPFYSS